MTNADRIRAMTDEALAEWLIVVEKAILYHQPTLDLAALRKDWLDWLKQEVEE